MKTNVVLIFIQWGIVFHYSVLTSLWQTSSECVSVNTKHNVHLTLEQKHDVEFLLFSLVQNNVIILYIDVVNYYNFWILTAQHFLTVYRCGKYELCLQNIVKKLYSIRIFCFFWFHFSRFRAIFRFRCANKLKNKRIFYTSHIVNFWHTATSLKNLRMQQYFTYMHIIEIRS